jgi:hypothetical protein
MITKNLCWESETGETTELTDEDVIAMYNRLLDDNHALCRENAELKEQLEQLKTASGMTVKALRKSKVAIRKLQEELHGNEEEALTTEDVLAACKEFPDMYEKAKELVQILEQYPNSVDASGAGMSLRALYGMAMNKKNVNEEAI